MLPVSLQSNAIVVAQRSTLPNPPRFIIARCITARFDLFVPVAGQGYVNVNSWLLFWQYAACFGVELTINNVAASYFSDEFDLSTSKAGIVASLFGLMNLFARSLGGIWSGGSTRLVDFPARLSGWGTA